MSSNEAGVTRSPCPVAIVLVNWNGRSDLLECLESLLRLENDDVHIVVCDNASTDGSVESLLAWAQGKVTVEPESPHFKALLSSPIDRQEVLLIHLRPDMPMPEHRPVRGKSIALIETGGNLGFAGGNNVGMKYVLQSTDAAYIWLLNTDTVVPSDALSQLLLRAQQDPGVGIVGSSLVYYWSPDRVQGMGGARMDPRTIRMAHIGIGASVSELPADPGAVERDLSYIIGASMLVSRAFVEQIGPMCEDYFLYYEEADWALRAKGRFSLAYAPGSIVYHKVGGSSARKSSIGALRYLHRNRLKFVARFLPHRFGWTLAAMVLDMIRAIVKFDFKFAAMLARAVLDSRALYRSGRDFAARPDWDRAQASR